MLPPIEWRNSTEYMEYLAEIPEELYLKNGAKISSGIKATQDPISKKALKWP